MSEDATQNSSAILPDSEPLTQLTVVLAYTYSCIDHYYSRRPARKPCLLCKLRQPDVPSRCAGIVEKELCEAFD